MDTHDSVEVYVERVLATTDMAILCLCEGSGDDGVWIPRSEILEGDLEEEGDSGYMEIPEWLAMDREIL